MVPLSQGPLSLPFFPPLSDILKKILAPSLFPLLPVTPSCIQAAYATTVLKPCEKGYSGLLIKKSSDLFPDFNLFDLKDIQHH